MPSQAAVISPGYSLSYMRRAAGFLFEQPVYIIMLWVLAFGMCI